MARRIVPRKHGRTTGIDNSPITLAVHGGITDEVNQQLDVSRQMFGDDGSLRRLRVIGGLPDELAGERMSAEERAAYDKRMYGAIFGGSHKHTSAVSAPDEEQQP